MHFCSNPKNIICETQNSPLFGIMIHISTDISVTRHIVIFATNVKEDLSKTVF